MKFTVVLTRDEDGFITAECPDLPGCVSQGKTRDEALKNITEAISLWLESSDRVKVRPSRAEVTEVTIPAHD
jgi:predicted RNase H-like HicB family nuclease